MRVSANKKRAMGGSDIWAATSGWINFVSSMVFHSFISDNSCFKSIIEGCGNVLPLKKEGKLTSDEASSLLSSCKTWYKELYNLMQTDLTSV